MSLTKVTYSMVKNGIIDVMNFGATGDGTTDDSDAIQAAITHAQLSSNPAVYGSDSPAKGSCTVFFPSGQYKVTKVLTITNKIALLGEGQTEFSSGSRIVQSNPNLDLFVVNPPATGTSFSIEKLVMRHTAVGTGILVNVNRHVSGAGCNSQRYVDCTFGKAASTSVKIVGDDVEFLNCLIDLGFATGFQLGTNAVGDIASNVRFIGCSFFSIPVRVLLAYQIQGLLVTGCSMYNEGTYVSNKFFDGIDSAPTLVNNVTITGNNFRYVSCIFGCSNATNVTITGNTGTNLGAAGAETISVITLQNAIDGLVISGNLFSGSYGSQSFYSDGRTTTVTNVAVTGNVFIDTGSTVTAISATKSTGIFSPNVFSGFTTNIDATELLAKGFQISTFLYLPYSASISTDASTAGSFGIVVTDGAAFTITNPTRLSLGQKVTYRVSNNFGTLGTLTWGTTFKLATWVQPTGGGASRSITFMYNGTNLVEVSRDSADIPT